MSVDKAEFIRGGLSDQVYNVVLDRIMGGKYEPGQRLAILTLAGELGVSSTPIREALSRLVATGLVTRQSHKGFQVSAPPDSSELDSIMEARELLEPAVAAMACQRGKKEFISSLTMAFEEQKASGIGPEVSDFLDYMHADDQFHSAIWTASGNMHLYNALVKLGGVLHRWRAFEPGVILDRDVALDEHEAILEAFVARDSETVFEAMRTHVVNQRNRIHKQGIRSQGISPKTAR